MEHADSAARRARDRAEHDALAPVPQVERIREVYPEVRWHAFDGAHLYPAGLRAFQRIIRSAIEQG